VRVLDLPTTASVSPTLSAFPPTLWRFLTRHSKRHLQCEEFLFSCHTPQERLLASLGMTVNKFYLLRSVSLRINASKSSR